jgi:hypothetical protein
MERSLPQLILPIKLERSSERLTSLGGRRLSRILCLGASWFLGFESAVKDGVERIEGVLDGGGDAAPASGFERALDGLDDVRRGPGAADRIRIVQESQVRVPFFADLAHEARGAGLQVLTKVLELCGGDLGVPGGFQGAEALIEFGRIGLSEVALSVALEVNDTELDVGLRKQALGEGEEAGEVVVDPPQETPQAALDQAAQPSLRRALWAAFTERQEASWFSKRAWVSWGSSR